MQLKIGILGAESEKKILFLPLEITRGLRSRGDRRVAKKQKIKAARAEGSQ